MDEKKPEVLTVENQRRLTMTGVLSVDAFTPDSIAATLANGRMTVTGNALKVLAFSKSSGSLSVEGVITAVKFGGKKVSFLKRLTR